MRTFNVKVSPIKNKENMLTQAMMDSDDEIIAKAIQDMLNQDTVQEQKPKKAKRKKQQENKEIDNDK